MGLTFSALRAGAGQLHDAVLRSLIAFRRSSGPHHAFLTRRSHAIAIDLARLGSGEANPAAATSTSVTRRDAEHRCPKQEHRTGDSRHLHCHDYLQQLIARLPERAIAALTPRKDHPE
jgi:hypothetical protein